MPHYEERIFLESTHVVAESLQTGHIYLVRRTVLVLDDGTIVNTFTGDEKVLRGGVFLPTDFAAGAGVGDVIQVDTALFANFAAIQSAAQQVGSNTVISSDAANTITLTGVTLSNLNANDFLFV